MNACAAEPESHLKSLRCEAEKPNASSAATESSKKLSRPQLNEFKQNKLQKATSSEAACFHSFRLFLVEVFVAEFTQCLALQSDGFVYVVFEVSLHGYTLNGFSAYSLRKQTTFHTHGERAVSYVALLFRQAAPNSIALVENGVFSTFKSLARGGTGLGLSHQVNTS